MTFGFGIGAGLRALTAARIAMQTVGNNLANINTPGYSRQRVELAASLPFTLGRGMQVGSGVDVTGITRLFDGGIERRLRLQVGIVAGAEVDQSRFAELEGLLDEPDNGLGTGLGNLFGSIQQLQTHPGDRALRGGVVQSANELAQQFQLLSRRVGDLRTSTFTEVRGLVREVNQVAASIAQLNGQIIALEANGSDANDLHDTRAEAVKRLSDLMGATTTEQESGSLDVFVGGHLLVSGTHAIELDVGRTSEQQTEIHTRDRRSTVNVEDGRIAALLRHEASEIPSFNDRLDRLTRNLILEFNRAHTTGMPGSGPFRSLASSLGGVDGDGDGARGDELLAQGGFDFEVQAGSVYVTVSNLASGRMERTRVDVDPEAMTLEDFAAALSAIDHLTATVDPTGRLRMAADAGYGFDFSPRLDPQPDSFGSFGGIQPSVGSALRGPYDLSGQTFPVSFTVTNGTNPPVAVTLDAADFADPARATVDELATAINADVGTAATARAVGGRLVIRSNTGGDAATMQLADVGAGTSLAALGLSTAAATGQDTAVAIRVEGRYTGAANDTLVFVPESDGEIGVTNGLRIRVLDGNGNLVTTVDVGDDYEPGDQIDLGNGVNVSFGPGRVSATDGDVFALDALADSDTTDILVALGMNPFFLGTGADDIAVNPTLLATVDELAAGFGTASDDASNLARLVDLRQLDLDDLDANTVEDYWADVVGDVGFAAAGAERTLQTQDQLLQHLEAERESVSGVNVDEEAMDMVRFQQSFEAAARYLAVVQEMSSTLINLGR